MHFQLVPKSVTLNDLILHYFTEFVSFWGALHKSGRRCRHKKFRCCLTRLVFQRCSTLDMGITKLIV